MKKYLHLIWLLLLSVALLCGCGKKSGAPAATDEPEPTVTAEESTSVVCSDGSRTLRFRRNSDDQWEWVDDVSFPLDEACVAELIAAAQELETLPPITLPEAPEFYGLVGSKSYLHITRSDGSEVTYRLGKQSDDGGYYCCSSENDKQVCVAPEGIMAVLGRNIYDMARLPELPDLSPGKIRSAAITQGDATDHLAVSRGTWSRGGQDVTGEDQIQLLTAGLETLTVLKCVDYAPAAGAAAVCGLEPPAATLVLELDKSEFTLHIGEYSAAEGGYFVTIDDDTTIYLMDGQVPALLTGWSVGG